jgi:hypothetical protein
MLADGRRFRCPVAVARSTLTADTLEHAKGCVPMRSLVIPPELRAVVAAISRARQCFARQGVPVTGGPVLPANPANSTSADGELIAGSAAGGAFIGFYTSAARAQRLEPEVARNASRFAGEVQRRGAVTVVWVHAPSSTQRKTIDGCAVA